MNARNRIQNLCLKKKNVSCKNYFINTHGQKLEQTSFSKINHGIGQDIIFKVSSFCEQNKLLSGHWYFKYLLKTYLQITWWQSIIVLKYIIYIDDCEDLIFLFSPNSWRILCRATKFSIHIYKTKGKGSC